jgi:endonuclease/exonuclease/phosphatase family metal-dependent hydrolase
MAACLAFGKEPPLTSKETAPETSEKAIRIVAYNVRNYRLQASGEKRGTAAKPEREIEALVKILQHLKPDVLGICEMGQRQDLADLQRRLKLAGIDLPHQEWVDGPDADRHLALLSRFPIAQRDSQTRLYYRLDTAQLPVQRGILDVTLAINPHYQLRMVGLHLKSQREVAEGDQALMRRNEAHVVRNYLDQVLQKQPLVNLLVYGDLNETKDQPGIRELKGAEASQGILRDIPLADEVGDRWTYFYEPADEYARIDYLLASAGVVHELRPRQSFIYRGSDWSMASDHRPLALTILPIDHRNP